MIPFLDLKASTDEIRGELDEAYCRFMDSGWYVLGEEVDAFEREYAAYCDVAHCVGVGTGLDALTLALRALDVGPGDQVIVPSNTYIATWLAVTQVGAEIVPVEPNIDTYNLDPNLIHKAITPATKVIMPVNLYGQPVDYDAILEIARANKLKVVIDNAQAHGARYKQRRVGGLADIECHSFYPSKNLGAYGEAGAITTNDLAVAEHVRSLRNYGSKVRYHNDECGTNSRLDALQAALLRVKLRHLDEWNGRRKKIADSYLHHLSQLGFSPQGVTSHAQTDNALPELILPHVPEWANPVWHLFVVRSTSRDSLQQRLTEFGVGSLIHYPVPPHLSGAYQNQFDGVQLPVADALASSVLSLPMGPHLQMHEQQAILSAIASVFRR